MAERKSSKAASETKKGLKSFEFSITNAREMKSGDILFNAVVNEINLYGMAIKKGDKGEWVAMPSRKGNDDKYYKYFYLNLDDKQTDALIQAVFDKLDE